MRLHYKVDQVESLRRGINAPNREVSLEVDPATLPESDRELLAAYTKMDGDGKLCVRQHNSSWLLEAKAPGLEELMVAIRESEVQVAKKKEEEAKRLEASARQEEVWRQEWLNADPKGDKWLRKDKYMPGDSENRWSVYSGRQGDPEIEKVRAIAQVEADRRNAELDGAEAKQRADKAAKDAADKEEREAGLAQLKAWVIGNGSELSKLRLEEGYDCWVSAARDDYAASQIRRIMDGFEMADDPAGTDGEPLVEDRKCPTADEIKLLRILRERTKNDDGYALRLKRMQYDRDKESDDYNVPDRQSRTEVEVAVKVPGFKERVPFYLIPKSE